jgi:hypothetical protein
MNRIWGHALSLIVLGLATSAVVPACVDNDKSIFIRGLAAPPQNRQNGTCLYQPDPTGTGLFGGTLDVGVRDNYFAVLLVGNQMNGRGDPLDPRTESNRIHFNGAVSRITDTEGNQLREFTAYATGFADIQQNNAPGYGIVGVPVIDATARDLLAGGLPNRTATKTVLVNVKVFGKTLGGEDLESGEFQFPVKVCNGCLVDFSTGNDPNIQPQPNCAAGLSAAGGSTTVVLPCFAGQDEATPCQLCQGRPACDPRTL